MYELTTKMAIFDFVKLIYLRYISICGQKKPEFHYPG